jgi:hypothetical protein
MSSSHLAVPLEYAATDALSHFQFGRIVEAGSLEEIEAAGSIVSREPLH